MTDTFDPFDYHAPTPEQADRIAKFREHAKDFRAAIKALPPGRETSLALTNLEQALMWANKAAVAAPRLALTKESLGEIRPPAGCSGAQSTELPDIGKTI